MREPGPDYSVHQYERPNQPWVCGLASEGHACPAGPTDGGRCPALAECAPARDGDRWRCNRSALRGGTCDEGPTPEGGCGRVNRCHPTRSLRSVRGRFVAACALVTVGALTILLSADWRDAAISPGPLARAHGQLLNTTSDEPSPSPSLPGRGNGFAASLQGTGNECAACHAAAESGPIGWTASLVLGHSAGNEQSTRCMVCHEKSISPQLALAAHNVSSGVLKAITNRQALAGEGESPELSRRDNSAGSVGSDAQVACAACHHEHQGAAFDMTAIGDTACQSCHQQRYESFAADHPEFGAWPYERRTRIAFDHASHRDKHFAEQKRAFDCRACHMDDATGQVQLTASYEAACASCHVEKIATSVAQGIPMFSLPTLDVEALTAAGHNIGKWPEEASGDFDGRLPPAMKLLLAGDPAVAEAIDTLGPDFEFLDVDPDDAKHVAASAAIARGIRQVLLDSVSAGAAASDRLKRLLGRDVTELQLRLIFAGLSSDTVRAAASGWLPDTLQETSDGASEAATPAHREVNIERATSAESIAYDPHGEWWQDDATLSIRYRPSAHADPVLAGWLELLAATPNLEERPLALAMFEELTKPTAPGLCASCHSVEQTSGGQLKINWRAHDRSSQPRGFTKFTHGPHLVLPQLADCASCHAIESADNRTVAYEGWNARQFTSEFAPVAKQQCAQCHTATAAGDACQSCHSYHVEAAEDWRVE